MGSDNQIINFYTANKAATHLGRKLYSTTPPALAELIANSYDAYAKNVYVELGNDNTIVVADNGNGMDLSDLTEKYAIIGNEKQPEAIPKGFACRKPMGKKGIGKLASFSMGDGYPVYTKKGEGKWRTFSVKYADYINADNQIKYSVESFLTDLPQELSSYADFEHGTIIVISDLRRNITQATMNALNDQLSRRFFIEANRDDFVLYVNNKEIDLSRNVYYGSLESITYIGFLENEIVELISPESEDSISIAQFEWQALGEEEAKCTFQRLVEDLGVKGWIGTVSKPKELKQKGSNNSNVVVYINGKIADEDVLKNDASSMFASEYIVGEFFADYLGESEDDPITSSRQGLDHDDENVAIPISAIARIRNQVLDNWGKQREQNYISKMPTWLQKNESYHAWESALSPTQRKLNTKLMKAISIQMDRDEIDNERSCALVNSIINVVSNEDIYRLSAEIDEISNEDSVQKLTYIAELLTKVASSEDLKQAQIISERLAAITQLEKLMADPQSLEKAFEDHLFDNSWLINPYWNKTGKADSEIEIVRQKFRSLYDGMGDEHKRCFIDIYIEVAEEPYPIIVELKKNTPTGHAKVGVLDIQRQITKYRNAIIQGLGNQARNIANPSDIKAFFILSEDTGLSGQNHAIQFTEDDYRVLETLNIELIPYNEMVANAKKAYRDHLKVLEAQGQTPYLTIE